LSSFDYGVLSGSPGRRSEASYLYHLLHPRISPGPGRGPWWGEKLGKLSRGPNRASETGRWSAPMALDRHRCTRVASTASWGYSLAHPGAHGSGGRRAVAQASCRPIACRSRLQRGVEVSARLSPRFLSPRSFFLLIQLRHSPFTLRTSFFSSQRLFYCSSALFPVSRSFHFILFFFSLPFVSLATHLLRGWSLDTVSLNWWNPVSVH
ncbi:hypothetical protein T310_9146, partial [Rasamsonia emersonii CBS 393.64]